MPNSKLHHHRRRRDGPKSSTYSAHRTNTRISGSATERRLVALCSWLAALGQLALVRAAPSSSLPTPRRNFNAPQPLLLESLAPLERLALLPRQEDGSTTTTSDFSSSSTTSFDLSSIFGTIPSSSDSSPGRTPAWQIFLVCLFIFGGFLVCVSLFWWRVRVRRMRAMLEPQPNSLINQSRLRYGRRWMTGSRSTGSGAVRTDVSRSTAAQSRRRVGRSFLSFGTVPQEATPIDATTPDPSNSNSRSPNRWSISEMESAIAGGPITAAERALVEPPPAYEISEVGTSTSAHQQQTGSSISTRLASVSPTSTDDSRAARRVSAAPTYRTRPESVRSFGSIMDELPTLPRTAYTQQRRTSRRYGSDIKMPISEDSASSTVVSPITTNTNSTYPFTNSPATNTAALPDLPGRTLRLHERPSNEKLSGYPPPSEKS